MGIDTVLFDLDGTLVDTNDLIITSFEYTLAQFFPNEKKEFNILPYVGEPLVETFSRIHPEKAAEMVEVYRIHNAEHHDELIKEYDGVYETVKELKQLGVKLAVVTNKLRQPALRGLEMARLDSFFDVVVTFDDVERAKPDAEPVMKALRQLGAEPESSMMVGDSQFDIEAGNRAGTKTAGVAWSLKGKEFIEHLEPDYVINHMSEIIDIVGVQQR